MDGLIALTSVSVVAPFPSKFLAKAAFLAAFVYSGVVHATSCPSPRTLSPPIKVDRVIDGDTVKLADDTRVRLTGFNTFELKDSGWKKQYAQRAKGRVRDLLPQTVQITPWPAKTDRYGRLLGNLWLGSSYLAESLVAEGLAITVSIPPENRLVSCLFDYEREARLQKRGVWSLGQLPEPANALSRGGFQLRRGTVTHILDNQSVVLDGRLRVVHSRDDAAFQLGARFEVRGWVSRSPKSIRRDWPWTLKLKDSKNRIRAF